MSGRGGEGLGVRSLGAKKGLKQWSVSQKVISPTATAFGWGDGGRGGGGVHIKAKARSAWDHRGGAWPCPFKVRCPPLPPEAAPPMCPPVLSSPD